MQKCNAEKELASVRTSNFHNYWGPDKKKPLALEYRYGIPNTVGALESNTVSVALLIF